MTILCSELELFRNPEDYLTWFNALLEKTKETRNDSSEHRQALLHQGDYKFFYEEIFPLASLLNIKKNEWSESLFSHVRGNQDYDVRIKNHELDFLEITNSNFDEGDVFLMKELLKNGSVDVTHPVIRDSKGKPAAIETGTMRKRNDAVAEILEKIRVRIKSKSEKTYPKRTGLIVSYDYYKCYINHEDQPKFDSLLEESYSEWSLVFDALFIVGFGSDICFEKGLN